MSLQRANKHFQNILKMKMKNEKDQFTFVKSLQFRHVYSVYNVIQFEPARHTNHSMITPNLFCLEREYI